MQAFEVSVRGAVPGILDLRVRSWDLGSRSGVHPWLATSASPPERYESIMHIMSITIISGGSSMGCEGSLWM